MTNKTLLIIMDGWGIGQDKAVDAIAAAQTPFVDSLYKKYPNSTLTTFGKEVGLPEGQMGNSEVGHLNLGAGRIVHQELERINLAIQDKSIFQNPHFVQSIDYCLANNKPLHFMGLVSDGGVHAHIDHLIAMVKFASTKGVQDIFIHAFTDGRDTDPESGLSYIQTVEAALSETNACIASITGRFFAMDRDKRWERIKKAYDNIVFGKGLPFASAKEAIKSSYKNGVTDEFMEPISICTENGPVGLLQKDDAVICFNFRTDRCREITEVLTQKNMPEHKMEVLPLRYYTMTEYDKNFEGVNVLFTNDNLKNTLGEVLEQNGKKQIRIAETEKYPHVTFFFSGGREKEFVGEERILKPSPKDVLTYDLKPAMSAFELKDAIIPKIKNKETDFVCLNFANADMVGHTGIWDAAIKAAETVDACVEEITKVALENNYAIFLTADHGNSDFLINEDGSPNTAHTKNPVPLFFISNAANGSLENGKLADIAPTILNYMGLETPNEMTGNNILSI